MSSLRFVSWPLAAVLVGAPLRVHAQQCPNAPSCNAIFGSVVLPTKDVPLRVTPAQQASPDGKFTDNVIALSYNRGWSPAFGWYYDNSAFPAASFGFESYWNGNSELTLDLFQPRSRKALRPFGLSAAYDGSNVLFNIGGSPYGSNAGGVTLSGGNGTLQSLFNITDQAGRSTYANMLQMLRQDGTASVAWRGGGIPRINFALQPNLNANGLGNFGVMRFGGEWDYGEPLLDFEGTGTNAMLIRSLALPTDSQPRLLLFGDGRVEWGPGSQLSDTNLYRSDVATLETDGNLIVRGNLAVMGQKAAVVQTSSFGDRELYALESPGDWFEDFGSGRLVGARALVKVEPVFGETVSTNREYHVFITSNGRCSLYVSKKKPTFFEVRLLTGSRSCRFDYRLVAKRKGYESVRLAQTPELQDTRSK
jgi:hypothetical protein